MSRVLRGQNKHTIFCLNCLEPPTAKNNLGGFVFVEKRRKKMKKILILSLLITPIMAQADVGPAQDDSDNPVMATHNGPYVLATPEDGDSTTVVSASYVKGAYNDAIMAINRLKDLYSDDWSEINNIVDGKRVSALATWGSDQTTELELLSTY